MDEFTARTVVEFLSILENEPLDTMYRGQGDLSWPLVPSICRFAKYVDGGYDSISELENHLVEKFVQFSVPFQDLRCTNRLEQLVYCQHFGLPTRLLDWSTNPLKALFFAVEDPKLDKMDATVTVLFPKIWWESLQSMKMDIDALTALYPESLHVRVISQNACFTAFPLPETGMEVEELLFENYSDTIERLFRVLIPKEAKRSLRQQLAIFGVGHQSIYPGSDGVARWVKSVLSNFTA